MNTLLRQMTLPAASTPTDPQPAVPIVEYEHRMTALYQAADCRWVLVYGDREHAANLAFLTHFDPRFEEALLVLGPNNQRTLILGNEGMGYTPQAKPALDFVLCQTLGLMGQPRNAAPRLDTVLQTLGLRSADTVGIVGWKYLEAGEDDDLTAPAFVPAYLVRHVQRIVGNTGRLIDVTHILMHPTHGLKSQNSAAQIAAFEWASQQASAGVQRVIRRVRPGQRECDAALLFGYPGLPFSCHPMLTSASPNEPVIGLRSPGARMLRYGDGVVTGLGYAGALCARGGLLTGEIQAVFCDSYVRPYYTAIATWYNTLRVGISGGAMHDAVMAALEGAPFRPALNPGHLISIDEWTHTPIRENSPDLLASGMALQCDIIPAPMPNGQVLNCEDGVALADPTLRAELAAHDPALWRRIQTRCQFMREALGLTLDESVLPLSDSCALLAPFWLAADVVCTTG